MNNKVILYGLIAVVVLLVAFNFNKITGQVTKTPTTTMVVEKIYEGSKYAKVDSGQIKLTINGYPGNCVDRDLSLYQKRTDTSKPLPLSTSIEVKKDMYGKTLPVKLCQKVDYQYGMQGDYHGDFYFEAKDLNTGKLIKAEFSLP